MSENKFSKKELNRFWLSWMQHCACGYNYARMMGSGVAHVMRLPIQKLYKDDIEKQGEEMKKHLSFFNTEPHIGSLIIGTAIAMEEERAAKGTIEADDIEKVKTSLMGPFAGIGDSLIQGAIVPIFLSIGIGLALQGNVLGPVLFAVVVCGFCLWLSHWALFKGYYLGKEAILKLMSNGIMQKTMAGAGIVGCTVMGALAASTVAVKSALELKLYSADGSSVLLNLQADFLDKIFLGMLPLAVIALVMKAFHKGFKPTNILFTTLIISFALGALGIIS